MAQTKSRRSKTKPKAKAKGPFKSSITGRFLSRAAAARWPKSSFSLRRRRKR